ncbi:MAG: ABC transporter substrate-binding protein [Proteobacteria bacterium]|nr:ABC transporter substrate-binding protein [Pseudomonadota bacterium]
MRKSTILAGSIAVFGLLTGIAVQVGQAADSSTKLPHLTNGDGTLSARQADLAWRGAGMDSDTDLELILNSGQVLSESLVARLTDISPAAGPEFVDPDRAVLALRQLGSDAVGILNDGRMDQAQRVAEFHALMAREFDIPLMARFALGNHWKRASAEQRVAYLEVFGKSLLNQYAAKIAGAKVTGFDVLSAQQAGGRDVMVQSRITQSNGQILKLVWRMRQSNGQFRVIDVVAEGISLALTKRQEFAAIIKSSGGDVAQLIARLRHISA